jgi:ethanolamine utilization protein EutA
MLEAGDDSMTDEIGGRTFFTNARRSLVDEDEIELVSIGIDIGSSTSHCAFSRVTLERVDTRYVVAAREVLFESDILLTPYIGGNRIDTEALDRFLKAQYAAAGIGFDKIDTGALILTGTAVRRNNARAIADLFAEAAGKFVSVSAGDAMEAVLAAFGSGAAALSAATGQDVLNVDIGGGTTKIARCVNGEVVDLTAIDIGARILATDASGALARIEPAGSRIAGECGIVVANGDRPHADAFDLIADRMADHLIHAMSEEHLGEDTTSLLRLAPLRPAAAPAIVTFSGGVSEYVYARETVEHGDLGPRLAARIAERTRNWGPEVRAPKQGIRATVIGASQYTVQISGSTIFVSDLDMLPLRNLPTILPAFAMAEEAAGPEPVADAIRKALTSFAHVEPGQPIAVFYRWTESATFRRLDNFCRGVAAGLADRIAAGCPIVLIGNSDVGGLIGVHFREEMQTDAAIVSIDGIELQEFDFVDIGAMLEGSGSVPAIIKSLVFPASDELGRAA